MIHRILVAAAVVLVAGCGFHLRGSTPLPAAMAKPWLDAPDRYTALHAALTQQLRAAGVTFAASPAEASAVIHLHLDETGRDLLSISAQNRPGEYEVYYRAEFSVTSGAQELLARQHVGLTRSYGYDETAVLAKEHEEQSLRASLADEIASLILRRLASL